MDKKISLTGIKPTGMPHFGNFFGAINPALELTEKYQARYFIADYHALNTVKKPQEMIDHTYAVAATWLACGLDPQDALIYRQSDVPETHELATFLMAFTAKSMMNKAHAYKARVQDNQASEKDADIGVNMGLYTYPVLMAADILLYNTNIVPVGRDQKQHVEITADIAQSINHNYGEEILVIPEAIISESCDIIIGTDGRKMSKSYNNTIPLFQAPKKMRKQIMKVTTNSQEIEEAKDPETCNVFSLYKLFANQEEQDALAARYRAGGLGWGHAKQELYESVERKFSPMREKYDALIEDRELLDKILKEGGEKARTIASSTISRIRKAAGFPC
ncbi:tryptophan--tRNA ligase [Lentisphaera profundi]|uniref:Tryptophan--tRNA ligase n=1 Tax=Lentisphaera profundi TaxID=1658616 RepID=A0ABY7VVP0_9BACT|nr:tryptophan--tRNA ligase [Lentisphaera profundi]WDE96804.1 tryptophan--tRNA ligase [Lentisphaera profundi]